MSKQITSLYIIALILSLITCTLAFKTTNKKITNLKVNHDSHSSKHENKHKHHLYNYVDQTSKGGWKGFCSGKSQSPIDIPSDYEFNTSDYIKIISTKYPKVDGLKMNENQHITLPENYGELMVRKNGILYRYVLADVHFHIKSEHTFDRKNYDLEIHMVHKKDLNYLSKNGITQPEDEKKNLLLVVGTLFKAKPFATNYGLDFGLDSKEPEIIKNLDLTNFANPHFGYYHYIGGLTTPSCNEIVNWIVNSDVQTIDLEQKSAFYKYKEKSYPMPVGNNRLTQKLNGRIIYKVAPSGLKDE